MSNDEKLLAILALGPDAAEEEIRTAYRRLAKRLHPDSSRDPSTATQFARVTRAYKLLSARPRMAPGSASGPQARYRHVLAAGDDLFALGQILASDPDVGGRRQRAGSDSPAGPQPMSSSGGPSTIPVRAWPKRPSARRPSSAQGRQPARLRPFTAGPNGSSGRPS